MDAQEIRDAQNGMYGGKNKPITDGKYDQSLAVKCVNGTFVGQKKDNIFSFKGIPFVGQQPVGNLRWKAPVDVTADNGVYEAYCYGKAPIQEVGDPAAVYGTGEDCLYLNIWYADDAAEKKPVMVWIYGGAFDVGGTTDPQYDCHNFIQENPDVIVVTITYRINILGFFHLSHLSDGKDYPDAQNLGLLDQMMALKWVRQNIAAFGGDPDNVTIWGESAGGGSCTMLPLIKGSHQYFKRVISQSGAPAQTRSKEQAIAVTNKVMEVLGCKTVADLQKVSAEDLMKAWAPRFGLYNVLGVRTLPERDGIYLPLDPWEAYANGAAKDIVFLQGCNKDEMNTFMAAMDLETWNAWVKERTAEKMAQLTDKEKALVESWCNDIRSEGERKDDHSPEMSYEPGAKLFGQIMFIAPQVRLSEEQAKAGGKSYTYYYRVESSQPLIKAGHASELSVVFAHPELTEFTGRVYDEAFCKTVRKMWVQFAKTGNPSLSAAESPDGKVHEWPIYDLTDKKVMVLDEKDIHPAEESELKIVDWERTYFLTNYYMP